DVFSEALRNAVGRLNVRARPVRRGLFGALNALLNLAHAGQILVELLPVAGRKVAGAAIPPPRPTGSGELAGDAAAFVGDIVEDRALLALAHQEVLLALSGRTGAEKAQQQA